MEDNGEKDNDYKVNRSATAAATVRKQQKNDGKYIRHWRFWNGAKLFVTLLYIVKSEHTRAKLPLYSICKT